MLFLCYPRCSTCQKAKKWMEEHNIEFTERNIAEENPSFDELQTWYKPVSYTHLNGLLSFMQAKKKNNGHYNAFESRELLKMIKLYEDMEYVLKPTHLAFRLDEKLSLIHI